MTNTEIIYSGIKKSNLEILEVELEDAETRCKICGKPIRQGAKWKGVLSGNFTDFDFCRNIKSGHICLECATVIKTRELRTYNFIISKDKAILFKQRELEKYLFNIADYIEGDFVVGITRSFKKHNSFRCRVNSDPSRYFIREEDAEYLFDTNVLAPLYKLLNEAYLAFTKDELLTGQYRMITIQEFGLEKFRQYEEIFKQHRGTHQFNLLVYMMDSGKRNEIVKKRLEEKKEEKNGKANHSGN